MENLKKKSQVEQKKKFKTKEKPRDKSHKLVRQRETSLKSAEAISNCALHIIARDSFSSR